MKEVLLYSLEIMGKGMLSIFVVIILLTLIVMLLAKIPVIQEAINRRRSRKTQEKDTL